MKPFVQLIGNYKLHIVTIVLYLLVGHIATATIRYVKPAATGTGTGFSWANASGDLQAMITASASGDEVWVKFGTYKPIRRADALGTVTTGDRNNAFVLKTGVKVYGGFIGSELFLSNRDYTLNITILSGDIGSTLLSTDNCYHVVVASGAAGNGQLDGFTVQNGYANVASPSITVNGQSIVPNCGAGIHIVAAAPLVQNCIIKSNTSINGIGGAGIFSNATASPTINNCKLNTNKTTGTTSNGGGLYIASINTSITNCDINSNTSSSDGAGLYIATAAVVAVSNCDFISNTATGDGAGLYNHSSTVSIVGCNFTSNNSSEFGAGVYNQTASPSISSCQFSQNNASQGGGIYNSSSSPSINKCSFTGNTAQQGAALTNFLSSTDIKNSIFSGNEADYGAAIYQGSSSSGTLTNCTIAGNIANFSAGAISATSGFTIKNCIIWGNAAGVSGNGIFPGTNCTVTFSIVQDGYPGGINADPLFISPQPASSAPTSTGNYRLRSCSPAIDAGNNTGVTATDLDGNTRIMNTTVDMGAYEKQYPLPAASGIVYVDKTKNGDGKTWATAITELADALKAAKTNTAITQIWVAKGTYYPLYDAASLGCRPTDDRDKSFVLVNNVKLFGGFAGGETTTAGRNFVTNETILSGDIGLANDNTDNCYHVAISTGAVSTTALDGFTLTKGNANGMPSTITVNGYGIFKSLGGGVYNAFSDPTIANCSFSGNLAKVGGGMYNYFCSPTITNCSFSGNAVSSEGGGMVNIGGSPTITNCSFSGNSATDGGGMYNEFSSSPIITNSTFSGNAASADGGGLHNNNSNSIITNSTFSGNVASSYGAGVFNTSSTPIISNSIIWGNTAPTANAIFPATGSTVNNSIIQGGYAGAIDIDPLFLNPQPASAAPSTAGNYRLHPCSPAVNMGNNADVPGGITTDLDGNPRFVNTTVDMGAYEVQTGASVSVTPAANIVYVDNSQFGDGSSWASATHNLADALKAAKTNSAIQQIWVKKGTYYPLYDAATLGCAPTDNRDKSFVLVTNVKLFGGFAGGETTTAGRNFVTNETILSADIGVVNDNTDNSYHVAISAGAVGTAALDGFTVTKGNANGGNTQIIVNGNTITRRDGGGMENRSSSPIVTNCIFSGNSAAQSGGGLANFASSPTITNSTITGNTSTTDGGGMFNSASSPIITNCTFSGNAAPSVGGGMYNLNSSYPTVTNCSFLGNSADFGGGMENDASSPGITNSTFLGNSAAFGGGIYNYNSSSPIITNNVFSGNAASTTGGGMVNNGATPALSNTIIWGNTAPSDNAISPATGLTSITNNIIQGGYPTGTNIINADPLFVAPQPASAAPTTLGDYHLQACSPAINLGDNSLIPGGIITDLDDNTRIKFIDVDMGAYEVQTQDLTQSTWRGINTNWNDRVNWCGGYIPTASTNVTIPTGLVNYPTTAAVNAVKNITLGNSTSVTVSNTGSLSINGAYANSGSNITNNGDWIMTGSAAGQSFPGSSGIISAMNNLEINNPSGIAFDKSFSITGALIPTAGNINVNNNIAITLKSSAAATANLAKIQPAASISYTGSGAFIVERFINTGTNIGIGQHAKSWQFLATPTTGQSIFQSWQESGTTPAGFGAWITGTGTGFDATTALPSLKYFDQVGFNWTPVINTGSALQNKLGYMLFVRGDRTVTAFNVAANNTVLRSKGQLFSPSNPAPSVPVPANTFQTFGNPYASRIEFNKVLLASTGINDVFYVWDPKLPGTFNLGGYQTITGITGYIPTVGTPPTGNAATAYYPAGVASPYIESGQAVFVKGSGTGGNVNFNENVKATGSRLVNKPVGNNDIANRQFLFTTLFTNTGEIADGNIIAFENGFGNEINENDATKLMNGGENFGLSRNGNILAVEAREPVAINDTLHYYMNNLRQQDYQLRFAPVNMDAVDKQAYLIDRCSGAVQQVIFTDSTYFDFTVSAATASSATDRFIIVFRLAAPVPVTFIDIKAYNQQENVNTQWQVADEINIYAYIIEKSIDAIHFDSIGVSAAHGNNGSGIIKYDYPDTHPVAGVNFYRIKSIGLNNEINYSKIVSVKRSKINAGISIYPNPVIDGNLQLWFTDMPGGTYTIRLFNTVGQLIVKEQIGYDGYNNMVNIRLNKLVAHGNYNVEINGPQNIRITMPVTN